MRSKGSHKLKSMGDVQAVLDAAPDLTVAAKRLGVDRSTITRWMQQGKVTKPEKTTAKAVELPAEGGEWATTVKKTYLLSETDLEILAMAEDARVMAKTAESERDRLSAMGRFQLLVKQLDLCDAKRVQAEQSPMAPRQTPMLARPRSSGDPRALLMAVK